MAMRPQKARDGLVPRIVRFPGTEFCQPSRWNSMSRRLGPVLRRGFRLRFCVRSKALPALGAALVAASPAGKARLELLRRGWGDWPFEHNPPQGSTSLNHHRRVTVYKHCSHCSRKARAASGWHRPGPGRCNQAPGSRRPVRRSEAPGRHSEARWHRPGPG